MNGLPDSAYTELDPHEFRLLAHYHHLSFTRAQANTQTITQVAKDCRMTILQVGKAKKGLRNKGYVIETTSRHGREVTLASKPLNGAGSV